MYCTHCSAPVQLTSEAVAHFLNCFLSMSPFPEGTQEEVQSAQLPGFPPLVDHYLFPYSTLFRMVIQRKAERRKEQRVRKVSGHVTDHVMQELTC